MPRKVRPSYETENDIFAVRLREIMVERGINKTQLAEMISLKYSSIQKQTISLYTTGQSKPDTERLTAIAKSLNVSADYLLGISEVKAVNGDIKSACAFLGINDTVAECIKDYVTLYGNLFEGVIKSPIWYEILKDMQELFKQGETEGQNCGLLLKWSEAILYSDFVAIVGDIAKNDRIKRDFEREAFEKGRVIAGFDQQIKEEPDGEHKKD